MSIANRYTYTSAIPLTRVLPLRSFCAHHVVGDVALAVAVLAVLVVDDVKLDVVQLVRAAAALGQFSWCGTSGGISHATYLEYLGSPHPET